MPSAANVMALQARLSQIRLGWIGLGILITVFQIFLGALRWREISALCEAPLSVYMSKPMPSIGKTGQPALSRLPMLP